MFHDELSDKYLKDNKGKVLGRGCTRICYEHKNAKSFVFKKAKNLAGVLANLIERDISHSLITIGYEPKIVALVHAVSGDGKWVMQERAQPVSAIDNIRKGLIRDAKASNFGTIKGELVKVDYGQTSSLYNSLIEEGYVRRGESFL